MALQDTSFQDWNRKKRTFKIVIAENEELIYFMVEPSNDIPLTWGELQSLKNKHFPGLSFVEVYPSIDKEVNKANNRHLFHYKQGSVPDLSDIERDDFAIKIYE